jgi:hypothetical protein
MIVDVVGDDPGSTYELAFEAQRPWKFSVQFRFIGSIIRDKLLRHLKTLPWFK